MQYDSSQTFREIHGSVASLDRELRALERFVVHRGERERQPIPLRFLTPVIPQPRGASNTIHLRLTRLGEHTTASEYVAVSYTWMQPPGLEVAFKDTIPNYRIWISEWESRPPMCPPLVLHRALHFAQERLTVPRIWIDQECILQHDPVDVEQHLQIMHRIYEMSTFTAAVLSQMIDRRSLLKGLRPLIDSSERSSLEEPYRAEPQTCQDECSAVLAHLAKDTWFTRAWTLQEKYCASTLFYLVPILPGLAHPGLDVPTRTISIPAVRPRELHEAAQRCNALSKTTASGLDWSSVIDSFEGRNLHTTKSWDIMVGPRVVGALESCHNTVVSDRVAIFANICRCPYTLKSRYVEQCTRSYSTSVLAIVLANYNVFLSRQQGTQEAWEMLMDVKIGDVLDAGSFLLVNLIAKIGRSTASLLRARMMRRLGGDQRANTV